MMFNVVAVTILATIFFGCIDSQIEVIPVRAGVNGFNEKYVKYSRFFVNRYGRKSIYYANIESEILDEWNNNVTLELVFYEKLGNVYKRSFVEIKYRLCDLMDKDGILGPTIRATGYTCPVRKGDYHLMNMTLKKVVFPYKMPFEHTRVDGTFLRTDTREVLASGYIYLNFRQQRLKVKQ